VKVIKNDDTGPLEGGDGFMEFKTHDFAERVLKMYNGAYMPDGVNKFILEWPTFIPEDNLGKYVISVGNLSKDVNDFVLEKTFRCFYDSVKEAKVEIDEITGVSKGYGFVKFNDKFEQMRALNEMEGLYVQKDPCRLDQSPRKTQKVCLLR
jgi:RNA recognition motif-containing protein